MSSLRSGRRIGTYANFIYHCTGNSCQNNPARNEGHPNWKGESKFVTEDYIFHIGKDPKDCTKTN
jgi:hypothetical protein